MLWQSSLSQLETLKYSSFHLLLNYGTNDVATQFKAMQAILSVARGFGESGNAKLKAKSSKSYHIHTYVMLKAFTTN